MSYNGWKNRETWACSINLRNNYLINKLIERYIKESGSVEELEFLIKKYVKTLYSIEKFYSVDGLIAQIVRDIGDVNEVDFNEIATSFFTEK